MGWLAFLRLVAWGGAVLIAAMSGVGPAMNSAGLGEPSSQPIVAAQWPALVGRSELAPPPPPAAPPPLVTHRQVTDTFVQPGETLGMVADRLGFSLCAVEAANPQLGPDSGRSFDDVSAGDAVHRPSAEASCPQPAYVASSAWTPPITAQHAIVISLSQQHMWIFDGGRVIFDSVVTTGRAALPTPVGDFSVLEKKSPIQWISPWPRGSPYYYDPIWSEQGMLYKAGGYWIHDAPWQTNWGPGAEYITGSHGCINTPVWAMPTVYAWAHVGDPVLIRN